MDESLLQKILNGRASEAEKEEALRQQSNEVQANTDEAKLKEQSKLYPASEQQRYKRAGMLPPKHNENIDPQEQALEEGMSPLDFPMESAALIKGAGKLAFPMLRGVVRDIPELVGNEIGAVGREVKAARNAKIMGVDPKEYKNIQRIAQENKASIFDAEGYNNTNKIRSSLGRKGQFSPVKEFGTEEISRVLQNYDDPLSFGSKESMIESIFETVSDNVKNSPKHLDYLKRQISQQYDDAMMKYMADNEKKARLNILRKEEAANNSVNKYSTPKSLNLIQEKMGNKANGEQINGLLSGLKADEKEALGLHFEPNRIYTKDEVIEYINNNTPQVHRLDLGDNYKNTQTIPIGENYREYGYQIPDGIAGEGFTHPHFRQADNLIGHSRVADLIDESGNKSLLAHEIQSDLHQAGRKFGYDNRDKVNNKMNEIGDLLNKATDVVERDRLTHEFDSLFRAAREEPPSNSPFKNTWEELIAKNLLKEASDKDLHSISWPKGVIKAEQGGIGHQIKSLSYEKMPKGNGYHLLTEEGGYVDVLDRDLDNYVGKDVANKIRSGVGEPGEGGSLVLKDDNLKIGTKPMEDFYDKKIASIFNKIGKKYGSKTEDKVVGGHALNDFKLTPEMKEEIKKNGFPLFMLPALQKLLNREDIEE